MNARPYFNYLLLAIAGAWSPTHTLAQTIPDSQVVPLKKFSVDENIVVLKGSWALGMGGHYRKEALEPMEPGDFGFAGHGMAHFALSKTDSIIQVHGIGPFSVKWVVPLYELSDNGVLLRETAEDPGRLLTQYRIQKQDGKRFWGQLADLEIRKGN